MDAGHMRTLTSRDIFSGNPCLDPQDIADAVLYVLGTPPHVQVITSVILWKGLGT
jgi:NADP-dependent 3-hydroxy acid dehydrogenase YdfG